MLKLRGLYSRKRDSGLTLVELLVAITVTAILAAVLVRIASDSAQSLQYQIDKVKVAQSSLRFAQAMRYDVAGSVDLFAFGSTADYGVTGKPSDVSFLCSTWRSATPAIKAIYTSASALDKDRWEKIVAGKGFVRTLITIKILELVYDPTVEDYDKVWFEDKDLWVGYEVRSARPNTTDKTGHLYMWRVTCDTATDGKPNPDITEEEQLLDLGNNLTITSIRGTTALKCYLGTTLKNCGMAGATTGAGSTATVANQYSFAVPFANLTATAPRDRDAVNTLKPLSDVNNGAYSLLQRMTRRITN